MRTFTKRFELDFVALGTLVELVNSAFSGKHIDAAVDHHIDAARNRLEIVAVNPIVRLTVQLVGAESLDLRGAIYFEQIEAAFEDATGRADPTVRARGLSKPISAPTAVQGPPEERASVGQDQILPIGSGVGKPADSDAPDFVALVEQADHPEARVVDC